MSANCVIIWLLHDSQYHSNKLGLITSDIQYGISENPVILGSVRCGCGDVCVIRRKMNEVANVNRKIRWQDFIGENQSQTFAFGHYSNPTDYRTQKWNYDQTDRRETLRNGLNGVSLRDNINAVWWECMSKVAKCIGHYGLAQQNKTWAKLVEFHTKLIRYCSNRKKIRTVPTAKE